MNEMEKVQSFLESLNYCEKSSDANCGRFPFVTISRQAGAGGNSLGLAILEAMSAKKEDLFQGWQKFNQELCRRIAEEPDLKVSLEPLLRFEYRSEIEDMMEEMVVGATPQDVVNKKIFQLMRTLASFGKVILVGRGGACLTRDCPLGIHIRLVAPLEARIKRMGDLLGLDYKKSKNLVAEQDHSRMKLVKNYFNRNIDDPLLYHAIWNTGAVSMEEIARSIVLMIEQKAFRAKEVKAKK